MENEIVPTEVKFAKFVLGMTRALADKALRWAAMLIATGITVFAMIHPTIDKMAIGLVLVGLLSPLWLRRERE